MVSHVSKLVFKFFYMLMPKLFIKGTTKIYEQIVMARGTLRKSVCQY